MKPEVHIFIVQDFYLSSIICHLLDTSCLLYDKMIRTGPKFQKEKKYNNDIDNDNNSVNNNKNNNNIVC